MENRLIIVSERDISDWLKSKEILADKVFTDVERFKNSMNFLKSANIVFLIQGLTSFNRNWLVKHLYNPLRGRALKGDRQIKSVRIVSNVRLGGISEYYMYMDTPFKVYLVKDGTVSKNSVDDFWGSIEYSPSDIMMVLGSTDSVIADLIDKQEELKSRSAEDYDVIKKPSFDE